jgi:isopenicillin N synthase-like dioxygenase
MELYNPPSAATHIPVIDMGYVSDIDLAETAKAIHRACRESGFFYVSNHGISDELIARQFAMSHAFFALPEDEKMAIHMRNSPSTAGYEAIGGQVLDSQKGDKGPADLKESFYCGTELPDDHPMAQRKIRAYGHNQWPASLPDFREQCLAYREAVSKLGDRILSVIALSLDLPKDWFAEFYAMPSATLRMICYPPQENVGSDNQIGAGAHTDWGGITILAQDNAGGLEVRNAAGEWIMAPPIEGTFVINLGDLMARWTNGLYNSNMHRVNNNVSGRERHSIPFFYSPHPDTVIEAMPTCVDANNPRQYETCTAAEHIGEMFRRSYGTLKS